MEQDQLVSAFYSHIRFLEYDWLRFAITQFIHSLLGKCFPRWMLNRIWNMIFMIMRFQDFHRVRNRVQFCGSIPGKIVDRGCMVACGYCKSLSTTGFGCELKPKLSWPAYLFKGSLLPVCWQLHIGKFSGAIYYWMDVGEPYYGKPFVSCWLPSLF